jgi:hypothetical protein
MTAIFGGGTGCEPSGMTQSAHGLEESVEKDPGRKAVIRRGIERGAATMKPGAEPGFAQVTSGDATMYIGTVPGDLASHICWTFHV